MNHNTTEKVIRLLAYFVTLFAAYSADGSWVGTIVTVVVGFLFSIVFLI